MKRKILISFEWWNAEDRSKDIPSAHEPFLYKEAMDRIDHMKSEGYYNGSLSAELHTMNGDHKYEGWWNVTSKIVPTNEEEDQHDNTNTEE